MKKVSLWIIAVFFLSGCSAVSHLDELLTLKAVGNEQTQMDNQVERQNKLFKILVEAVQKETFPQNYPTKVKIVKKFGEPIFSRPEKKNDQDLELCLYRKATEYFDSDKVYLYFDSSGNLVSREYVQGQKTK